MRSIKHSHLVFEHMKYNIKRWSRIFAVAALHEAEILILGAFGCGVFGNPPLIVSQAARKVCKEFNGVFEKIIFAVFTNSYENDNYRAFSQINNLENESTGQL